MKLEEMKKKKGTEVLETTGDYITVPEIQRNKLDINYSEILSRLMKEAAEKCHNYASDLFISWESMLLELSTAPKPDTFVEYFGFRDLGVDHETFISVKLENPLLYGKNPYHSIFRLEIIMKKDSSITMVLTQIL